MEKVSFMKAAQQLGVSVADIEKMIGDKKLKEVSQGKVSKEAVYALSGLSADGNQTKNRAGRKPNVMTFESAAAFLNTDLTEVKELVESGDLEVCEGTGGVRGPKEAMVKMYKKKMEDREEPVKKMKIRTAQAKPIPGAEIVEQYREVKDVTSETKTESVETEEPSDTDEVKKLDANSPKQVKPESHKSVDKEQKDNGIDREKETHPNKDDSHQHFNLEEIKEAAYISYKMGRLSVYESMSEFKRKVSV